MNYNKLLFLISQKTSQKTKINFSGKLWKTNSFIHILCMVLWIYSTFSQYPAKNNAVWLLGVHQCFSFNTHCHRQLPSIALQGRRWKVKGHEGSEVKAHPWPPYTLWHNQDYLWGGQAGCLLRAGSRESRVVMMILGWDSLRRGEQWEIGKCTSSEMSERGRRTLS